MNPQNSAKDPDNGNQSNLGDNFGNIAGGNSLFGYPPPSSIREKQDIINDITLSSAKAGSYIPGVSLESPNVSLPLFTPQRYSLADSKLTDTIDGRESTDVNRSSAFPLHQTLGQIAETFHDRNRVSNQLGETSDVIEHEDSYGEEEEEDGDNELALGAQGAESTGRWTRQEHELFLEALKKYGKEWKKVASMVKTRTVVQTRTHAQKYFQKLAKANGGHFPPGTGDDVNTPGTGERPSRKAVSGTKRVIKRALSPVQGRLLGPPMSMETPQMNREDVVSTVGYYPLETNELTPFAAHITPASLPRLTIPPPPSRFDFPQPSPAACGKRKHAELTAAEMLAGSAQSHHSAASTVDVEGIRMLSRLKDPSGNVQEEAESKRICGDISLSIMDPNALVLADNSTNEPSTPWDREILALQMQNRSRSMSRSNSCGDIRVNVSTPSEQRYFLAQVRNMIAEANIDALKALFEAAHVSAENYLQVVVSPKIASGQIKAEADNAPTGDSNNNEAKELIQRSLNKTSSGERPVLHAAILSGASQSAILDICKLLLDYGASVKAVDGETNTALHLAAERGLEKVGRLLLSKGCPANALNARGDAAVHIAARHGQAAFLETLANLGANFHLRNSHAMGPLDLAGGDDPENSPDRDYLRKLMLTLEPRLRSLILYHDDFLDHSARRPSDWEAPDRVLQIMRRLRNPLQFAENEIEISSQFEKADVVLLGRAHSPDYLAFVHSLSKQIQASQPLSNDLPPPPPPPPLPFTPHVQRFLHRQNAEDSTKPTDPNPSQGSDTSFSAGTLRAARRAAGAVAHAVDRVLLGRNRNAFCVVRPPGHHAGYRGLLDGANSCGFCIFNNVAAGALHALEDHHCERVAIVDLDIHHGNGTEDIVRRCPNPSRLFFFSLHLFDLEDHAHFHFYPGTGQTDDHVHNIVNVPLAPLWKTPSHADNGRRHAPSRQNNNNNSNIVGSDGVNVAEATEETAAGREAYRRAIVQRLIPSLRAFNPSLILLSMGFDTLNGDVGNCKHAQGLRSSPQRGMDLTVADIAWVTTEVMKIADICCNGRLVSVLEGGYGQYVGSGSASKGYGTRSSNPSDSPQIDAHAMESQMNRGLLAEAASAHVRKLIDPYGPPPRPDVTNGQVQQMVPPSSVPSSFLKKL